ncbi:hypothetical protein TOPH_02721 [Tolypocladium ophioglossoides CBS 100239]|uniref:Uncharacterized protein n=1 Tax=Tolypocladium ophioglossoides (strain CBS 100239) TaxID=1163406 RepID=A0A0L0NF46_TOLOC|nr:hypothetical protein TOPH_02721 [Tolypocladium ophioglossoides CBS 100239]
MTRADPIASLHPPYRVLLKLWDIYVDRVDPPLKILHLPTFKESRSTHLCILSGDNHVFGRRRMPKSTRRTVPVIFARHERAARRALGIADSCTLLAATLGLMGVRSNQRSDTLFVLSGVAVRLALKISLD